MPFAKIDGINTHYEVGGNGPPLLMPALGISAMSITMGFPDNLEYYHPVFHLTALWLPGTGVTVLAI